MIIMLRYSGVILALMLLVTGAEAFPLTSQSDQANITVFGVILDDQDDQTTNVLVDVGKAKGTSLASASLVDTEDKFYNAYDGYFDSGYSAGRFFISFRVPKGTVIKRLKFEPMLPGHVTGIPFSIDWEAVPEVSDGTLLMKMYGVRSADYYIENEKVWTFDIKITNNGSEILPISAKDFCIVDQFGWKYDGKDHVDESGGRYVASGQLTPGESMRFDVALSGISGLSRPATLVYGNLSLDVSAWT
ncbi:MAG: hypothetical protein PHQ39_10465 [Methanothrix soehngenii]|nr:hypothetical protein [Methanothrix soehngenii]